VSESFEDARPLLPERKSQVLCLERILGLSRIPRMAISMTVYVPLCRKTPYMAAAIFAIPYIGVSHERATTSEHLPPVVDLLTLTATAAKAKHNEVAPSL
jgi:hypothetical protein